MRRLPALATLALSNAHNLISAEAVTCVDNEQYRSKLGLSCSQHKRLECEKFGLIGFLDKEVEDLLRQCPHSCRVPSCTGEMTARETMSLSSTQPESISPAAPVKLTRDKINLRRVNEDACMEGWDPKCQDDPEYLSFLELPCSVYNDVNCKMFGNIGFTEQELYDLINSCPCSCKIECGVWTMSPTPSPTFSPTQSAPPSNSPKPSLGPSSSPSIDPSASPSDVPSMSLSPSAHPSYAPSTFHSSAPSTKPSEYPSYVPSITPSALPSATPSLSPSDWPSSQPSMSFLPSMSSQPSLAPSESPEPTLTLTLGDISGRIDKNDVRNNGNGENRWKMLTIIVGAGCACLVVMISALFIRRGRKRGRDEYPEASGRIRDEAMFASSPRSQPSLEVMPYLSPRRPKASPRKRPKASPRSKRSKHSSSQSVHSSVMDEEMFVEYVDVDNRGLEQTAMRNTELANETLTADSPGMLPITEIRGANSDDVSISDSVNESVSRIMNTRHRDTQDNVSESVLQDVSRMLKNGPVNELLKSISEHADCSPRGRQLNTTADRMKTLPETEGAFSPSRQKWSFRRPKESPKKLSTNEGLRSPPDNNQTIPAKSVAITDTPDFGGVLHASSSVSSISKNAASPRTSPQHYVSKLSASSHESEANSILQENHPRQNRPRRVFGRIRRFSPTKQRRSPQLGPDGFSRSYSEEDNRGNSSSFDRGNSSSYDDDSLSFAEEQPGWSLYDLVMPNNRR